jgi:hypothetical protein
VVVGEIFDKDATSSSTKTGTPTDGTKHAPLTMTNPPMATPDPKPTLDYPGKC